MEYKEKLKELFDKLSKDRDIKKEDSFEYSNDGYNYITNDRLYKKDLNILGVRPYVNVYTNYSYTGQSKDKDVGIAIRINKKDVISIFCVTFTYKFYYNKTTKRLSKVKQSLIPFKSDNDKIKLYNIERRNKYVQLTKKKYYITYKKINYELTFDEFKSLKDSYENDRLNLYRIEIDEFLSKYK